MHREIAAKTFPASSRGSTAGKIRLDETNVVKDAVLMREVERNEEDLGNDDEPLDPRVAGVNAGADGKVDAEQDERDKHPLLGKDLPEDGEGREEAGKVSGVCDKDRRHIHDPQKEPGIPIERPCQHYPKAQQEAESGKEHTQDDGDQPTRDRGRTSPLGHEPHRARCACRLPGCDRRWRRSVPDERR